MSTRTPAKARRSKSEVTAEFDSIREEVLADRQERTPKDRETQALRETDIRTSVQDVSPETVVQRISQLQLDIPQALSLISGKLVFETKQLQALRDAVLLETQELERLHQLDVAKSSLDLLVEEYDQTKTQLEAEVRQTRDAWQAEERSREEEQKQQTDGLKLKREREQDEYSYERDTQRKREEQDNQERQAALDKAWTLREEELKKREEESVRLRQEAAAFPDRLQKETARTVAEALKTQQAQNQQTALLAQKEAETDKRLSEQRVKLLEETIARQTQEIQSLSTRLEEAKNQVQEIALKAIEGASGAKTLSHVSQIAMEQAKTRPS